MTEITIWDVQHGSAAYIKAPNGRHIIVDVGMGSYENGADFSPLYHLWKNYDVKQIDLAILTHPHRDHLDDIDNLTKLNPKVIRFPKHLTRNDIITSQTKQSDIPIYEKYLTLQEHNAPKFDNRESILDYAKRVSEWHKKNDLKNLDNFGGLQIQTFRAKSCATSNLNNQSILSVFTFATSKIVICGDNESASYNELLQQTDFKNAIQNADVLVASHHGRASGFHNEFVQLVNPQITVISDSSKKDTSVVADYGRISQGWKVFSRTDNSSQQRNTVSTYHDGVVHIKMGYNNNSRPFLEITKK